MRAQKHLIAKIISRQETAAVRLKVSQAKTRNKYQLLAIANGSGKKEQITEWLPYDPR